jgi:multicomponent Na+:H+ antiporter subunit D
MAAFSVGALSMIGVPPLAGFMTKWYLAIGAIEAKEFSFLIVLAVSTVLNAAYFLPILYKAYFEDLPVEEEEHAPHIDKGEFQKRREVSYFVSVPLLVTAMISLVLGIFPNILLGLIEKVI